jgi:dolichol kinase
MRPEEVSGSFKLSGVSYMFLGFFISCVLFSKGTAISSFLVLIISDSAASIIGTQVGIPRANGKSIEGSVAFGGSAFLIGMLSYTFHAYSASFFSIIAASIITTLVEYHSGTYKVNDNIAIPITYGLVISLWGFFI